MGKWNVNFSAAILFIIYVSTGTLTSARGDGGVKARSFSNI